MKYLWFLLPSLLICFTSSPTRAGDPNRITINSFSISRPAYLKKHPTQPERKIRDSAFLEKNRIMVPASEQLVEFYDKDFLVNEYCGSYWTDLKGEIKNAPLFCNDEKKSWEIWKSSAYDPADIKARVYAWSAKGFKIYKTTEIQSQLIKWDIDNNFQIKNRSGNPVQSSTEDKFISLGSWGLGLSSNDKTHRWAATLHESLDWTYSALSSFAQGWIPATGWLLDFPFGKVFTFWTTIQINASEEEMPYAMYSASHELGHAIYNKLHSGKYHFLGEVLYYAHKHEFCRPVVKTTASHASRPEMFAQYEGFADTNKHLLWAMDTGLAGYHPVACALASGNNALRGTDIEGNVDTFYFWSLMGSNFGFTRPRQTLGVEESFQFDPRLAPLNLRPLSDHYRMVSQAGEGSHTLTDMWNRYLRNECEKYNGSYMAKYCGSNHYKTLVKAALFDDHEIPITMNSRPDLLPYVPLDDVEAAKYVQ